MENNTKKKRSFSEFSEASLIDRVENTYLNPRKRRKISPSKSQSPKIKNEQNKNINKDMRTFNLAQYLNSVESHQSKQILQEMGSLETLTLSHITYYQNKIQQEMEDIEEQKQS